MSYVLFTPEGPIYPGDTMTKQANIEATRIKPAGVEGIEAIRKIKQEHQAAKVNQVLVDAYSASAVVAVYDKVNEANKAKLAAMPVAKLVSVCFKLIA